MSLIVRWATIDAVADLDVTKEKIDQLLTELRSWGPDEDRHTLHELAAMFDLDLFVVQRIALSEDMDIRAGYRLEEADNDVDPNASTIDLDPDAVRAAAEAPDPNPDWVDEDKDTGVWRKKPTGEWERVED